MKKQSDVPLCPICRARLIGDDRGRFECPNDDWMGGLRDVTWGPPPRLRKKKKKAKSASKAKKKRR